MTIQSRRDFLKSSSAIAAGSFILPSLLGSIGCSSAANAKRVGIQVYSVRNQLKEDFAGTHKKLAEIGYKHIEAYGLGADGKFLGKTTPSEYKNLVDGLGMKLVATHSSYFKSDDASVFIDSAKEAGVDYLNIPYLQQEQRTSIDDYKRHAENFNKIGEKCKTAGLKFAYHNHAFEFESMDGQIPEEVLIENTDADKVSFELDLYWAVKGGYDPIKLIEKYPGRIGCFHVKDANKALDQETVGQGIIDFAAIFAANGSNLDYYFVEDERQETPIENVTAACDYLMQASFG